MLVVLVALSKCAHTCRVACYQQVTRRIFEASGGRLKVVGKGGVGIENIDLAAATEVRSGDGTNPRNHRISKLPS